MSESNSDTPWRVGRAGALLGSVPILAAHGLQYASRDLITSAARRAMAEIGGTQPAGFSVGCFECRLADDPRVDVLACTSAQDGGKSAWRAFHASNRGAVGDAPTADRLLAGWANSRGSVAERVSAVWLEYDLTGGIEAPFAFLRVRGGGGDSVLPVVEFGLDVAGTRLSRGWRTRLRSVERALRPFGSIMDFAVAPHGIGELRLHLAIPSAQVTAFLRAIDWRGPRGEVRDLLRGWSNVTGKIGVQVQLGHEVHPWVDLEFFSSADPKKDDSWKPLLEVLRAKRLAHPDKIHATKDFLTRPTKLAHWPVRFARAVQIKVRLERDSPLSAKSYLAFSPRFSLV